MKWPRYGFTSYSCSCLVCLVLGSILTVALFLIAAWAMGFEYPPQAFQDENLRKFGIPTTTLIIAATFFWLVFPPRAAYWFIRWTLQDFWTSGREIWKDMSDG